MGDAPEPTSEDGRPLRDVYSVALGVALVLGIEQTIDLEITGIPVRAETLLTFVAFVATSFSLYHWATRFIDLFFAAEGAAHPTAATIITLLVGATELLALIALSILTARPFIFLVALTALWGFEVLAGLALNGAGAYRHIRDFGRRYLSLNLGALVAGAIGIAISVQLEEATVAGAISLAVSLGRAAGFYRIGFDLLFATPRPSR